jgi:hypothetical protein
MADNSDAITGFLGFVVITYGIACVVAWITHVVWIIGKLASDHGATVGQMVLGAIGAFMPPVGIVHGFMIWFGFGF